MFSELEKRAVDKKVKQLKKLKEGTLSIKELRNLITQKRIYWFKENQSILLSKYNGLSDEEKAHRIICFDEMGINPEHSIINRINNKKVLLKSYNFCPYLEACGILNMDTRDVCKKLNEKGIQQICEMINPKLKFIRNYDHIRSHLRPNITFCEEYFEIEE